MLDLITRTGDGFIWLTSVIAGMMLCAGLYVGLARRLVPEPKRAILGEWFGYAHFYARGKGERFYKERITVRLDPLRPWRLTIKAHPQSASDQATVYKGHVVVRPPFLHCMTYEPVFGDYAFEISRVIMGDEHAAMTIVGICMGKSYDDHVHSATAHIWTRAELDPAAGPGRPADLAVEREHFQEIARDYFEISSESLQLKLL